MAVVSRLFLPIPSRKLFSRRTLVSIATSRPSSSSSKSSSVAIFWDLDNKPPNAIPPYDAAVRLKLAASSFGTLSFAVAYANAHAFRHVPAPVRAQREDRRTLDRLEDAGVYTPSEPYVCRVCGRNFYNHTKFINHFKQLHEREQAKRLRRLESTKGSQRVMLAAKLSMKMEKYRRASRDLLVPKAGYGLADELRRAGVLVRTVEDRPEAADRAIREHLVDTMDKGRIGCLVLVSDDAGFAGVLREARMRCLRTVVVGDEGDGVLKRCADAAFSWKEVASGRARKDGASVVEKWKDREVLKRLEWTYRPEETEEVDCGDLEEGIGDGDDEDGGDMGLNNQPAVGTPYSVVREMRK